ncbi:Transcriptional repressor SmtB [Pseudoclavibacter triregionum]|nr:Transcriptional repressor SmtB [Pseudoclavibacter triregionum]
MTGSDAVREEGRCVHPDRVAAAAAGIPEPAALDALSGVFRLLGDPTGARLLYALLAAGELCVHDLAAAAGAAESTVSQALRMLRASGVVAGRRAGRNVFYRLADAHVRMLLEVTRDHVLHGDSPAAAVDEGSR